MKTDTPTRGRPRDEERTAAILDATYEVMSEVGYDQLRVQDVAERAGAGLATIYRRWSTKDELVAAAICGRAVVEVEPSGDPVADLREMVVSLATDLHRKREWMVGFMAAAQCSPVLDDAVKTQSAVSLRARVSQTLEEILGPDDPRVGVLTDMVPAVLLFRIAIMQEPVDIESLADEVLAIVEGLR